MTKKIISKNGIVMVAHYGIVKWGKNQTLQNVG